MVTLEREEAKFEAVAPLTVLPSDDDPNRFYVKACTKAAGWYEVCLGSPPWTCECPHFRRRLVGTGELCKHLTAALGYLEFKRWTACPICHGSGFIIPDPKVGYPDLTPIARLCCGGAGTRAAWEAGGSYPPEEGR